MNTWGVIYQYCDTHPDCNEHGAWVVAPQPLWKSLMATYTVNLRQLVGLMFLAIGIGGILGPFISTIQLETAYMARQTQLAWKAAFSPPTQALPSSTPVVFEPLLTPDGASIDPVSQEFSLIVPKVGINAAIIPNVDPTKPEGYLEALKQGVAHASTSFFPNQDGTVYLFSHSTNYDWFVADLNAIFYLLKNLEENDTVVLIYKGERYTYRITGKKVVSPRDTKYLVPTAGKRSLILQTCWPPGSTTQRLLIFADLVEKQGKTI
jgi:LPXTG-site transpeptidase (sortase) family protein